VSRGDVRRATRVGAVTDPTYPVPPAGERSDVDPTGNAVRNDAVEKAEDAARRDRPRD
jgi:hypothetical protein